MENTYRLEINAKPGAETDHPGRAESHKTEREFHQSQGPTTSKLERVRLIFGIMAQRTLNTDPIHDISFRDGDQEQSPALEMFCVCKASDRRP